MMLKFINFLKFFLTYFFSLQLACAWTDSVITVGATKIRKIHIDEMRNEINAKRQSCGLVPYNFTDVILQQSTRIRKIHFEELRDGVNSLYSAPQVFADDPLYLGLTRIKKTHLLEIRNKIDGASCPCNCSAWTFGACGGGGCSASERILTRACAPAGCGVQSQCSPDPSCTFVSCNIGMPSTLTYNATWTCPTSAICSGKNVPLTKAVFYTEKLWPSYSDSGCTSLLISPTWYHLEAASSASGGTGIVPAVDVSMVNMSAGQCKWNSAWSVYIQISASFAWDSGFCHYEGF